MSFHFDTPAVATENELLFLTVPANSGGEGRVVEIYFEENDSKQLNAGAPRDSTTGGDMKLRLFTSNRRNVLPER